jgi:predicted DNA-binding transcriptional regulator YafY
MADRVRDVTPLPATFERPTDFDALAHLAASISALPRAIAVEVLLETDLANALRHVHGSIGALTPVPGGVLLRSQEDDLDWYARQLARLPFAFSVQKPAALRVALRRCARRLEKNAERVRRVG